MCKFMCFSNFTRLAVLLVGPALGAQLEKGRSGKQAQMPPLPRIAPNDLSRTTPEGPQQGPPQHTLVCIPKTHGTAHTWRAPSVAVGMRSGSRGVRCKQAAGRGRHNGIRRQRRAPVRAPRDHEDVVGQVNAGGALDECVL